MVLCGTASRVAANRAKMGARAIALLSSSSVVGINNENYAAE
jgi:hypothetical protein